MEFQLRAWRPEDAESVTRYANNPKIAGNLRDVFPYPYLRKDADGYLQSCLDAGDGVLCLAIDIGGEAVGSIGVFRKEDVYRKSAELGYWLGEPFWGRGVMSAAVSQICELAFARFDLVRIFAEPFAYNAGSRRVLEKAGFRLEGVLRQSVCKNGQISDSCVYALLRPDWEGNLR